MYVCVLVCVGVCVCVSTPKLLLNNDMMWSDMDPIRSKFYSCYIAAVVFIVTECGFGIGTHRRH